MGKSSRVQNARLAQVRAEQAKAEQRRKLLIAGGTVGVVVLVVVGLVFAALQGANKDVAGKAGSALDQASFAKLTNVPASALDTVGAGSSSNPPRTIDAPALTKDGKPRVLYVGAEFCPYCASQRWPLVVALSRFGTFNNLSTTYSAPAPEPNPNTPTITFHGSTYTSQYLSFTAYETATNEKSNGNWKPLETLSSEDQTLFSTYNAPPYTQTKGAIPWLDIAGTSIQEGASWDATPILAMSHAQVVTALADPSTPTGQGVLGTANVLTAQICKATGGQPANVCTSAGVVAAAAKLQ